MYKFKDYYCNEVTLSFDDEPFQKDPKHVWVICRYQGDWLLTHHKERGYEFPGGKVEKDEETRVAAVREVFEETGATIQDLYYVGQYEVGGKSATIVKNIYFAEIDQLTKQSTYHETDGPCLFTHLPKDVRYREDFSFIMKDDVLDHCLTHVKRIY